MAEQDRLNQVFRNGAAVHRHERLSGPAGRALDTAGNDFLTHTAFPQDQDRNLRARCAFSQANYLTHRRRAGDHVVKAHAAFRLAGQALDLPRQGLQLQRILDRDNDAFGVGGLHDEIDRTATHGLDNRVDPARGGQHDHRQVRPFGRKTLQRVHARQARHGQVQQDHINAVLRIRRERKPRFTVRSRATREAGLFNCCL